MKSQDKVGVWEHRPLAIDKMQKMIGYPGEYAYSISLGTTWMCQDKRGTSAPAQMQEDGVPLAIPDCCHAEIADKGAGRYSIWGGFLYFSTSDNSDPKTNGRKYELYWPRPVNPIWTVWRCVYNCVKTKSAVVFRSSFWRSFFWSTTYWVCFYLVLHDLIKRKAGPCQNAHKQTSE